QMGTPVGLAYLVPLAAGLVYCAVRLVAADHALAVAKRAIDSGQPRAAATHYARFTRWRFPGTSSGPWCLRALLDLSQKAPDATLKLKAVVQAGAAAIAATQTAEDPFNAWYNEAAFDAARNDAAGAERSLRAAIATRPNWFKPHWALAQLLRLEGRQE